MKSLLVMLLYLGLGGTVMALGLMLTRRLLGRRLPGSFYYYAWLVVLLRFILPLPGLMPAAVDAPAPAAVQAVQSAPSARPYGLNVSGVLTGSAKEDIPAVHEDTGVPDGQTHEDDPALAAHGQSSGIFASIWSAAKSAVTSWRFWGFVWAAGAVISAAWYITGYERFVRTIRRTEREPTDGDLVVYFSIPGKHKPGLVRSRAVTSPMLMGIFRPTLVLPNREYSPEMLRNIFSHELTHYRRGDIVYKWFAALVFSLHWINPLTFIFRREIDRACELSCDEQLLKDMSADEKRSYGETLLELAAKRPLPGSVVATSFATQKRDLKERLEQIMTYKNKSRAAIALALAAALLLAGCGAALGPNNGGAASDASAAAAENGHGEKITVSTVDEFLAAIRSNATIVLKAGTYDLSKASDYGAAPKGLYTWEECFDGYRLVLSDITGLDIVAGGDVTIAAIPRYADVLCLRRCSDISITGVTLGHTEEPGSCAGGVLYLDSASNISLDQCRLYGCGVVGITAYNSQNVYASDCDIYDCSDSAVSSIGSRDVRVTGSRIYNCSAAGWSCVFSVNSSTGFAVVNSSIYGNEGRALLLNDYSQQVYLLGCDVSSGNNFSDGLFEQMGGSTTVDGCLFAGGDNVYPAIYTANSTENVFNAAGEELNRGLVESMKLEKKEYSGPKQDELPNIERKVNAGGIGVVHVSTVDELLAAIAPSTEIYLDSDFYDLSTASYYGGYGSDYYHWEATYDGPQLVITGVDGLSIISENGATVSAIPRYANVLSFINCDNVSLSGFTAGHTEEPGSCAGGVLYFESSSGISIDGCHLYGCGIIGIQTQNVQELSVTGTEIYDCSMAAVTLSATTDAVFTGCDIHNCGIPEFSLSDCLNVSFDGAEIRNGMYTIGRSGLEAYGTDNAGLGGYQPEPGFGIYYMGSALGSEITLHTGDGSVFVDLVWDEGTGVKNIMWTSSSPELLSAEPDSATSGMQCKLTPLKESADGVRLIVTGETDGGVLLSKAVTVYISK